MLLPSYIVGTYYDPIVILLKSVCLSIYLWTISFCNKHIAQNSMCSSEFWQRRCACIDMSVVAKSVTRRIIVFELN